MLRVFFLPDGVGVPEGDPYDDPDTFTVSWDPSLVGWRWERGEENGVGWPDPYRRAWHMRLRGRAE